MAVRRVDGRKPLAEPLPLAASNFGIGNSLQTPLDVGGGEVMSVMPLDALAEVELQLRRVRRELPALGQHGFGD